MFSLTARDESLFLLPETVVRAFTSCLPDYGTLCYIETETPAIYHQWVCAGFRILRESDCGNVVERSSGKGSVSNNYGFYSITLPPGKVVLSSSYVGYEPCFVTFELTCDTMIDLSLSPAGVLGGSRDKRNFSPVGCFEQSGRVSRMSRQAG